MCYIAAKWVSYNTCLLFSHHIEDDKVGSPIQNKWKGKRRKLSSKKRAEYVEAVRILLVMVVLNMLLNIEIKILSREICFTKLQQLSEIIVPEIYVGDIYRQDISC